MCQPRSVFRLICFALLATFAFAQTGPIVSTVAGGAIGNSKPALSAAFGSPSGVAYDSHGRLYISDQVHCQIRRIDKAGVVSKFAGSKTCGYGGDGGPAISALLANPSAIAFDPEGNLLVADTGNNRIRKITSAGVITTVAGNGVLGYSGDGGPATSASLRGPEGVFADALENIFIADSLTSSSAK